MTSQRQQATNYVMTRAQWWSRVTLPRLKPRSSGPCHCQLPSLCIHCSAKLTQIILLQVTLFVLPAEVRVAEVHTGGDGPATRGRGVRGNDCRVNDRRVS